MREDSTGDISAVSPQCVRFDSLDSWCESVKTSFIFSVYVMAVSFYLLFTSYHTAV